MQKKPPELPRNHPEQGTLCRHTLDSGFVPDLQMVLGSQKGHYRLFLHLTSTEKSSFSKSRLGQTNKLTSRRYSSPPIIPTSRRDNPPALGMSQTLYPMSQPPQISHSSQPVATDGSSLITSIDEAADVALEPFRLRFKNF